MKSFSQSLIHQLEEICSDFMASGPESRELRIFFTSFPPSVALSVGDTISDYLKSFENERVQFIFRIGNQLWKEWNKENHQASPSMKKLEENGWVDTENRLTHYRNLKWDPDNGYDRLVVMLMGVEQATDGASLSDFFLIDTKAVWSYIGSTFSPWLSERLSENQIDPDSHIKKMDELLKVLYRYGAGDLLKISDFLDHVDFSSAMDGQDALRLLYEHLPYWYLPVISDMQGRKWSQYVTAAIEFFSYRDFLQEGKKKKAFEKIKAYRGAMRAEIVHLPLQEGGEFKDGEDLLNTLSRYIDINDLDAKKRLLRYDFAVVKDRILNYQPPKPVEEQIGRASCRERV